MALRTISNTGGNWSANGTWVEGSPPDSTMDVVATGTSGAVTIDTPTCVCRSLVLTGYTAAVTFTAAKVLTVSGSVTFVSGMTLTGTGTLTLATTGSTLTMGGLTFPGALTLTSAIAALTLVGNLSITGALTVATNTVVSGAYNISCGTLLFLPSAARTLTLVSGTTLTVTTSMTLGAAGFNLTIKAATASSPAYLVYQGTYANATLIGMTFTDIDASGSAVKLYNYQGAVLTRCSNIQNIQLPINAFNPVNGCSFIRGITV